MNQLGTRIEPFSALIFNQPRAGRLEEVIAPPFDLIDQARQEQLYARNPHNVVRLELNRDGDPYASAAATLKKWIVDGILERTAPAIFLYTQQFELDGRKYTRHGWVARIRLEEFTGGRIRPHERTFPKAREDRLRLLGATRANISSVFGLYPSGNGQLEEMTARVASRAPLLEAVDDLRILNQVRAVDSAEEIATIQHALENARVLIADGHHRYETALEYRRRIRGAKAEGAPLTGDDYVMMTLVAFDDSGLVILPTHRVIRHLSNDRIKAFQAHIGDNFAVEEGVDAHAMLARLRSLGTGYIGVSVKGSRPSIVHLKDGDLMSRVLPEAGEEVRKLDVAVLHAAVFGEILGITPEMVRSAENISYTIDGPAALGAVAEGSADGAFLLNAPTVYDVERVCHAGVVMPEKSTYFYPKLLTGLLINPLE